MSPATIARLFFLWSQAAKKVVKPSRIRPTAGTSSIMFTEGRNVGESAMKSVQRSDHRPTNRRNNDCRQKTNTRRNGKSDAFHRATSSPTSFETAANQ